MKPKIFIDGREGTAGLQIYDRLAAREDVEILYISENKRKDQAERTRLINAADIVFLCLPDAAAREAVTLLSNPDTRIIDASTAHRTHPDWVYGFPELSAEHRDKIRNARFLANPGCHATGFIASVYPLITLGILPRDYPLTCFSLTGYSGGGKKMIHEYDNEKKTEMSAPRLYGLSLNHKHIPEMMYMTGLSRKPVFCPIVCDYYCGLAVTVTLHNNMLNGKYTAEAIRNALTEYYAEQQFVTAVPEPESGMLHSNWGSGTNELEITVSGGDDLTIITARLDNLGKGASGAAVQNMNIMLGFDEDAGLRGNIFLSSGQNKAL